jgi:hypothetical protein
MTQSKRTTVDTKGILVHRTDGESETSAVTGGASFRFRVFDVCSSSLPVLDLRGA